MQHITYETELLGGKTWKDLEYWKQQEELKRKKIAELFK